MVVDKIDYTKYAKLVILEELLKNSNFISLNIPLYDNTYRLINENILQYLREDVSIINTSRGAIIDRKDLYEFLKDHLNANVGLNVLGVEPSDKNKKNLFKLGNVIFTPHISFYSE